LPLPRHIVHHTLVCPYLINPHHPAFSCYSKPSKFSDEKSLKRALYNSLILLDSAYFFLLQTKESAALSIFDPLPEQKKSKKRGEGKDSDFPSLELFFDTQRV
jgi:hypothetical protein